MGTKTIKINADGTVDATDPTLHKASSNGNNKVKWKSTAGTHTITDLPDIFSSTPPASITVEAGKTTDAYTVSSTAATGNYPYKIDGGVAMMSEGDLGGGSAPKIKVEP